jgi:translation initiation factor IF-2
MANYRVLVNYDPERSVFVARAPELEHCSAEGKTRAEAIAKVEEEIDAQLRNMREQGGRPPAPIDDDSAAWSGEITAKVSRALHRDLAWQARSEGVELPQLLGEMLAVGLEARRQRAGVRRPAQPGQSQGQAAPAAESGNEARRDDRPGPGGRPFRQGERGQGGRYHAIMEDRATFLEYVRGLESGRGPGSPGGGGGQPGGGGGGGRRRPRGRFGGGGEGGQGGQGNQGGPGGQGPGQGNET